MKKNCSFHRFSHPKKTWHQLSSLPHNPSFPPLHFLFLPLILFPSCLSSIPCKQQLCVCFSSLPTCFASLYHQSLLFLLLPPLSFLKSHNFLCISENCVLKCLRFFNLCFLFATSIFFISPLLHNYLFNYSIIQFTNPNSFLFFFLVFCSQILTNFHFTSIPI